MTYSDIHPERRNLVILSLIIIVFYIGDARLDDEHARLIFVNVTFHSHGALVVFVWSMLAWFLFRYNITSKNMNGDELKSYQEMVNMDYTFVRSYVIQTGSLTNAGNLTKARIYLHGKSWVIQTPEMSQSSQVLLQGYMGGLIKKLYMLKMFHRHRAGSDYFIPYILCFTAVMLGLCKNDLLNFNW